VSPEIAIYRCLYRVTPAEPEDGLRGSQFHQLIKMAMAEQVQTPFCLTLDADVFCMKPVCYKDLIREGEPFRGNPGGTTTLTGTSGPSAC
jgi:Family of unknown function (DUF6492)